MPFPLAVILGVVLCIFLFGGLLALVDTMSPENNKPRPEPEPEPEVRFPRFDWDRTYEGAEREWRREIRNRETLLGVDATVREAHRRSADRSLHILQAMNRYDAEALRQYAETLRQFIGPSECPSEKVDWKHEGF